MQYLDLATDETVDHRESDEAEELAKRALVEALLAEERTADAHRRLMEQEICSCGHFTCPARPVYGHPVPVFHEEIEPLYPQSMRDLRALSLKGGTT